MDEHQEALAHGTDRDEADRRSQGPMPLREAGSIDSLVGAIYRLGRGTLNELDAEFIAAALGTGKLEEEKRRADLHMKAQIATERDLRTLLAACAKWRDAKEKGLTHSDLAESALFEAMDKVEGR